MKNLSWKSLFISFVFFLASCQNSTQPVSDTPAPSGTYKKGHFVINEGNFGWGHGTISFIHEDGRTENEIFKNANGGKILGNVVQSMSIFDSKGFIVVNNSQKIEVVTPENMKSVGVIQGLTSPRYFLGIRSDKAYVTDLYANGIWVVNPKKMSIERKIDFQGWTERMLLDGKNLWVCNMTRGSVGVFDVENDVLIKEISLHKEAGSIVKDKDGKIWVLCSGGISEQNSKLFVINPTSFEIEKILSLPRRASNLQTDSGGENLFFLCQGLFKMNHKDNILPEKPVIPAGNEIFYGYTVKKDGDLLISDARDYVQRGTVSLYDGKTFLRKKIFEVGIIPGFFCEIAQ